MFYISFQLIYLYFIDMFSLKSKNMSKEIMTDYFCSKLTY